MQSTGQTELSVWAWFSRIVASGTWKGIWLSCRRRLFEEA